MGQLKIYLEPPWLSGYNGLTMMKSIIYFLFCLQLFLLGSTLLAEEIPEKNKLNIHKIEDAYWYAKDGKINLTEGLWHFEAKPKRLSAEEDGEKIISEDFFFCCTFTIFNNSQAAYRVNPSISLLDYDRASILRIPPAEYFGDSKKHEKFRQAYDRIRPFKPKVLNPGQGYTFKEELRVPRDIVLNAARLKLELSIAEINRE